MKRTCMVDGCERQVHCKGYCSAHWTRMRRTGSPGSVEIWDRKVRACSVAGCERDARSLGYCNPHHLRFLRHGDPLGGSPTFGPAPVSRDQLTYEAAHERVKVARGRPSEHACSACGSSAEDWAYMHTDPDPLVDDRGRPFSDDIQAYQPMCRSCHKTLDWAIKKGRAA